MLSFLSRKASTLVDRGRVADFLLTNYNIAYPTTDSEEIKNREIIIHDIVSKHKHIFEGVARQSHWRKTNMNYRCAFLVYHIIESIFKCKNKKIFFIVLPGYLASIDTMVQTAPQWATDYTEHATTIAEEMIKCIEQKTEDLALKPELNYSPHEQKENFQDPKRSTSGLVVFILVLGFIFAISILSNNTGY